MSANSQERTCEHEHICPLIVIRLELRHERIWSAKRPTNAVRWTLYVRVSVLRFTVGEDHKHLGSEDLPTDIIGS